MKEWERLVLPTRHSGLGLEIKCGSRSPSGDCSPDIQRSIRSLLLISHHLADDFVFLGKLARFELGIKLLAVFEHLEAAITKRH
jgi:hypothetical protein